MSKVVDLFNGVVTKLFDLILWPFAALSPLWGLTIISIAAGIALLLVYGKVSNQEAIRETKRKIYSYVLESVLFRHDLRTSLGAQGRMFMSGLKYFALAVPPIIILMVPCLVILAQLNLRYNSQGLQAGDQGVLQIKLADQSKLFDMNLKAPQGLEVTPPLRDIDHNEIFWRINLRSASNEADTKLLIETPGKNFEAPLYLKNNSQKIPAQSYASWWWRFFYPGDMVLNGPQDLIEEISFSYPESRYSILGLQMHWLVVFAIASILSGIVASKIFSVEI